MRYIGFIFALCLSIQAIASNTLTLSSVSGTPQTEVEVVVSLDNTDAITALEMVLPLGEHLSYVNGSATLATARSNGHQLSAAQVGQDLRIYIYSLSLNALQGNTGELLTFRLLLGNEPADYALTPTVVLSNAQGTSIAGSVQTGNVTIQAPKLQIVNPQIDYGHIPIRATYTKNLQLKNVGNLPLTIENITTTDPLFVPKQTTLTIEAGQTTSVAIEYTPTERGAVSAELVVKSNASNGEQIATIMADPFSVNELHVGSASGIADSIVTIPLTMNNMEPIVAMQCAFKLPKQLEYVANSLAVNATRSNGHQALSTLRGDTLFLAIFSMANQPLHANDGEVATFQLRLNGSSGTYYLKPIDVVLSNITEENMVSATSQGSVRINAPSISGNSSLSFGNIPITEVAHATYSVRNNGSAPLVLERATFLAEGYSIVEELPITIANSKTTTITVAYQPTEEGDFSTTMNLYTNDPNNRLKTVALSGHVYEPNALSLLGQSNQDGTYTLSVALDNYTDIVAVQYDLHWRSDMTTSQSAFVPSARMQNHNAVVTPLDEDSYQIIIYSMSNAPIAGHNGELHQLVFTPQSEANYCGSTISIDNIVLSNAAGGDKTSAKSITLRAEQTQWANDTATACDQYVWNGKTYTQSGIYIDTIPSIAGCDSIVTLHLTINNTVYEEEHVTACDAYTWNGQTYATTGAYTYTTTAANGCDSVVTLHLTINQTQYTEEHVTACDAYTWNGQTYATTGAYTYTTTATNGCDSIVTLHLTINNTQYAEEIITACDSYTWNGEIYTTSGEYVYTTTAANGCDSIVTLHLTINNSEIGETEYVTICYGETYTWNGQTYSTEGEYSITLSNILGCDSVATLQLTIMPEATTTTETVVIGSDELPYTWRGNTYSATGSYTDVEQYTQVDCDSVIHVLDLTVLTTGNFDEESITICETEALYIWYGESYTATGKYTYTEKYAGTDIDSVQHILNLTVNPTKYTEETITACDSYTWNGNTYTTSGDYAYTTTTANGCDSIVTLHLTINATKYAEESVVACDSYTWNGETYTTSGEYVYTTTAANGCDSIVTLHLTINATKYAEESVVACDSYTWNGQTYVTTGAYTYITTATNGCDSIVTLHLTINATKYTEETVVACDSYTWNGETYTESGEYTYTTTAANGCDSIVTLHLTINNTVYAEEHITACDSYTWNSETYTESGDYVYMTTATNGCDSIVTLHLTINNTQYAEESVVACDSYTWNGETYTESGEYTYNTTAANGCDSIVTLHLTINATKYAEETVTACDNYVWNGETYTESGEYTYTTTAANGCDSIVTLHLTINNTQYAEETVTACDSYTWNGETYTESGEYTYTTTAANGCDSIVTLHLTINATKYAEESVVACDSYTWNGETYTTAGEYTYTTTAANGCDSIITLHLTINQSEVGETEYATICYGETYTWNGQTYAATGEYSVTLTNAAGCDSIATLQLTIMPKSVTTTETVVIGNDELPYTWRGNTYLATGLYTDVEQYTQVDCDSAIHVLDLTVLTTGNFDEESITICETEAPYIWYGESYTATGKYTYTEKYTGTDIDSVQHILNLMVNPTQYTEEIVTACDSYTWNGQTYATTGAYTYITTAANGCDSIVTLHLTINNTQYAEEIVTACDSYTWNGQTYATTGAYTYTTTATNGCDSIVTLHLTINATKYTEETVVACDSYTWNGETYTESSEYTYTITAANGCDSIITLHLTINQSEVGDTEYTTICYGETYIWNGQTYTASGEYSVVLTNVNGCDSVATLQLTIMPEAVTTTETVVIGSDELPYTWRGNTYSTTGRYTDVEQYATVACDSAIYVLDLTVLSTGNFDEQSVTICETEAPYIWYGEFYAATGKYTYTEKYAGTDIDSVQHILNLTVNPTIYTEEHVTACDSYEWNGQTYTQSGDYDYTTTATNGCDSIVTLHLTINKSEREEYTEVACDEYVWNGVTYTESGDYTYNTTTAAGCERVEVLHLTINKSEYEEFTEIACDSYVWNGVTYTESGDYTYNTTTAAGCERVEVLHLTINKSERVEFTETACDSYEWNGVTYTESGDYTYNTTTAAGCERVEVLHLTILPAATTESETLALCPSELPYEWHGQWLTEEGTYSTTEQYAGMECDSIIHELTVNVYVQTLPATVTQPIVRTGEAIDVTIPTAEIQAHIAAEIWYAPNAEVAWYIMDNSDWTALTTEPVAAGTKQVTLKYAVETDCGNVESENMVIAIEPTDVENTQSPSPTSNCQKVLHEDHIYILRESKIYTIMGQEL